jgi:hypothetical protein
MLHDSADPGSFPEGHLPTLLMQTGLLDTDAIAIVDKYLRLGRPLSNREKEACCKSFSFKRIEKREITTGWTEPLD